MPWSSSTFEFKGIPDTIKVPLETATNILVGNDGKGGIIGGVDAVIEALKGIISFLEIFSTGEGSNIFSILGPTVRTLQNSVNSYLTAGATVGIFHPFNAKNAEEWGIPPTALGWKWEEFQGVQIPGISIRTLTPKQAVDSLIASLDDETDSQRPVFNNSWGMGTIVFTTGNLTDFVNLITSLNNILDFSAIRDFGENFQKRGEALNKELERATGLQKELPWSVTPDVSDLTSALDFKLSRYWYGTSLDRLFPGIFGSLKKSVDSVSSLLIAASESADTTLKEVITLTQDKIKQIQSLFMEIKILINQILSIQIPSFSILSFSDVGTTKDELKRKLSEIPSRVAGETISLSESRFSLMISFLAFGSEIESINLLCSILGIPKPAGGS